MAERERRKSSPDLKVFITSKPARCDECGENLGPKAWITLDDQRRAKCLACADLDELLFLPRGDAALTLRAKKHSHLSAVVLKWSRARKRYERQGIIVEERALEAAEQECLSDNDARARRRERAAERRAELDEKYVEQFAARIRDLFPVCPEGRERTVAEHACLKFSGRIGRSASAKALEEDAVRLAVVAHVRHWETEYDKLLAKGWDRHEARSAVQADVEAILQRWKMPLT